MTIQRQIAAAMEGIAAPITSVTVTAPLGGNIGILTIIPSGFTRSGEPAPKGVTATCWTRLPSHIEVVGMTSETERGIVDAAWLCGAWDIERLAIGPGYAGALPPEDESIDRQMRAQGWVSWSWRPMMCGPEIRQRAHARSDRTLDPIGMWRNGPAPLFKLPPIRPGESVVVMLGKSDAQTASRSPRRRR